MTKVLDPAEELCNDGVRPYITKDGTSQVRCVAEALEESISEKRLRIQVGASWDLLRFVLSSMCNSKQFEIFDKPVI